jgi:glutaredoxin
MFFVYGAANSKACEKAELLLYATRKEYRFYVYGRDYTLKQLQRLVPGANSVPQIFYGTKYLGGIRELYEFIYTGEDSSQQSIGEYRPTENFIDSFIQNKSNKDTDTKKE